MSGILGSTRQERIAEARQRQYNEAVVDPLEISNMRPWCRICGYRVGRYVYDRYDGGFYGFTVWCHGETMGGLIPYMAPHYALVLEVFCDGDPKAREGRWFWIGSDGTAVQYPRKYVAETAVPAAFTGKFAKFARDNATWIGLVPLAILGIVQICWRLR